jgi:hypothetical protein
MHTCTYYIYLHCRYVNNNFIELLYQTVCTTSHCPQHLGPFSTSVFVAPQIVARLKPIEHVRGNCTISDTVLLASELWRYWWLGQATESVCGASPLGKAFTWSKWFAMSRCYSWRHELAFWKGPLLESTTAIRQIFLLCKETHYNMWQTSLYEKLPVVYLVIC